MSDPLDLQALRGDFARDGAVVLADRLPQEAVAAMRAEIDRLMALGAERAPGDAHFDFEPQAIDGKPAIQRIKRPHEISPLLFELAKSPAILDLVEALIGPDIRLHHSKVNVKMPEVGSPLEWHQDWAFVPHTNPDLAFVSIAVDACTAQNGPLFLLRGTHRQGLRQHHHDGFFDGAIDVAAEKLDTGKAQVLLGPPGTLSIHHPLIVHGSGHNRSSGPRRILFFEYAAADAWPLFYGVEWEEYESRMVRGRSTLTPRLGSEPVRLPWPRRSKGMIYELQQQFARPYFASEKKEAVGS